ncbi:MAG: FG-GAP-like repeat-containing protein, partial [Myxococcota bacterium]
MAAPHVAGVAALILSAHPQYTVEEVRQALKLAADDTGAPGWDRDSGSGRVDAHASVNLGEPCSALIRRPVTRDVLSGSVDIRGVATGHSAIGGTNFAAYRVEFAAGSQPGATSWTQIDTSTTPVDGSESDSLLARWNIPATLPDGEYSLRLVVVDELDREYESRVRVEVDNYDPPEMSGWPKLPALGLAQLIPMIPSVADLDGDGDLEIVLGPFAWHHDGTAIVNHPLGFFTANALPASIFQGFHGAPAIGDIDGNGENEVILIHHDGFANAGAIHVFGPDGQSKPGWPKTRRYMGSIGRTATPVLADIDGDDVLDVIVLDSDGPNVPDCRLDVYRGDGSAIFGRTFAHSCLTIPTVADLDGDGRPEIILLGSNGQISVIDHAGHPAAIWPQNFQIDDAFDYIAPSVGDLDGDGGLDIVVPAINKVYAFASNGLALEGWPIAVACCDPSIPALADLDADGTLEVVIGDRDGTIHALDHRGAVLDGWPIVLDGPANTTPALADIDGDGALDVVAVTGDRKVHAWSASGQEISSQGWPITTGEYAGDSPFQDLLGLAAPPIIADIDGDGDREVIAFTRHVHVWDLPDAAVELPREWPMYRSNPRSSGNVDEDRVTQPPTDPRIYARPENYEVADIESFSLTFDLAPPAAQVAEAQWSILDADDPERAEIIGWLDGQEVDLAKSQALPAAVGLVSRTIRLPELGHYRVRASIRTEPAPAPHTETGEPKNHVFTSDIIDVIEVTPANPTTRIVPGASAFARTTVAAHVEFDLIEGLRLLVYTVVKPEQPDEPVLGTVDSLELGEVNVFGERDLSKQALIGLFLAAESPTHAKFAVNEAGEYEVRISILAYPQQLRRTIEVGSTRTRFTATEIIDTDADGWFDIQDNCPSVNNGIGQAPTAGCTAPPCVGNQIDTDGDGYGNACDGDLDGDGEVTGVSGEDCTGVDSDWCLVDASLGK